MKALLKTYTLDTLTETEAIELPENYDGNPYGDTVPFSVGSNQSIEVIESNTIKMKYAIKRYDGKLFPERYATRAEAQKELQFKLGNGATYGLAWVLEVN